MNKKIKHLLLDRIETLTLSSVLKLLRHLTPIQASIICGDLFKTIGPYLPVTKVAKKNLYKAFPSSTYSWRMSVIAKMWRNLGQNFGEFTHIHSLKETTSAPGYEIKGKQILEEMAHMNSPIIFFSGHIGNWELLPIVVARYGAQFATIYRRANNPGVNRLIQTIRSENLSPYTPPFFPKGAIGGRNALEWVKNNGRLGLLVDQKLNQGIKSLFFGRTAMTMPTAAILALHYQCPLVPAYIKRLGPAHLRFVMEPPLNLPTRKDTTKSIHKLVQMMNNKLESWIRKDPSSWLWIHNRWG